MPHVVTRFAPSPTGHLHIGGVRTALFCWAYARACQGTFILRVEDTDQARSSESSTRGILEDLAWVGLDWDQGPPPPPSMKRTGAATERPDVGPYFQAQRLPTYHAVIDDMLERDLAYPAFDTAEELTAMRDHARANKETFRYKRPADYNKADAMKRHAAGEPCVIRFNNPGHTINVTDEVLGHIAFNPEHTDDFVLLKQDRFPTYHFAVVVDDEQMGVTHVLRGQEHLNNTPRHVALQQALSYRTPVYAHLPLIFNPDGSKMSKRDKDKAVRAACKDNKLKDAPVAGLDQKTYEKWLKDKTMQLDSTTLLEIATLLNVELPEIDVDDFRRSGYLPDVLCNYVALLGWSPKGDVERFDLNYLIENFSFKGIGASNARFDRTKLASFNADTLRDQSPADFAATWKTYLTQHDPDALAAIPQDRFDSAARAVQPRIHTLRDAGSRSGPLAFLFHTDDDIDFDQKAVNKFLLKEKDGLSGIEVLQQARTTLVALDDWSPDAINAALKAFTDQHEFKNMGVVAQPLRVAVTGTSVSPDLGDTLALLGKQSTLERIDNCIAHCQSQAAS